MPRTALALAATATLLLNGSMALATVPAQLPTPSRCSEFGAVCVISLRMMSPPPARPADLIKTEASDSAMVVTAETRL